MRRFYIVRRLPGRHRKHRNSKKKASIGENVAHMTHIGPKWVKMDRRWPPQPFVFHPFFRRAGGNTKNNSKRDPKCGREPTWYANTLKHLHLSMTDPPRKLLQMEFSHLQHFYCSCACVIVCVRVWLCVVCVCWKSMIFKRIFFLKRWDSIGKR